MQIPQALGNTWGPEHFPGQTQATGPSRAASSPLQQNLNHGFQIIITKWIRKQLSVEPAFSGKIKDPLFLRKNRLTHLRQIFQCEECSECYAREDCFQCSEPGVPGSGWISEVIEHIQKIYNLLDFILFLLWEGPCSLGSLGAAPPALDCVNVSLPGGAGRTGSNWSPARE